MRRYLLAVILCLLLPAISVAAINAGMVWEVRTGGDDTNNGGGFRGGALVSAPPTPVLSTAATGGTIAAGTYYFVLTYTDRYGETAQTAQQSIVTTGTTSTITVTKPVSPPTAETAPAASYNIYAGTVSGGPYWSQTSGQALTANKTYTSTLASSGAQAPGVDRSQSTSAQVNVNNSTITATTTGANSNTLTFTLGYVPSAADVGNCFQATAGTNINAGVYEITAFTATTWTVTGATNLTTAGGAGSAIVGRMGGCFATPGKAWSVGLGGNTCWVAAATYSLGSTSNIAAGRVTLPAGSSTAARSRFYGYNAARFDWGAKPVLQSNANTISLVTGAADCEVDNFELKLANANTSITGLSWNAARGEIRRVKMTNLNASNCFTTNSGSVLVEACEVTGYTGTGTGFSFSGGGTIHNCAVHDCTGTGMTAFRFAGGNMIAFGCVVSKLTGSSNPVGFSLSASGNVLFNCVVYSTGGIGFNLTSTGGNQICINCVAEACSGTSGWNGGGNNSNNRLINCAGFNNTVDYTVADKFQVENFKACGVSPFTNATGGDFSLNSTSNGGALLKALGYPTSFPGLSTTTAPDIGAAQTQATTSTDPGVANVRSGTAYTINNSALTGTMPVRLPHPMMLALGAGIGATGAYAASRLAAKRRAA